MHSSIAVGNKLLEIAATTPDASVTPMQLIKLAYLSHGWMLGLNGRPLIGESVEAWRYGPVLPSLYNSVKHFRNQPVQYPLKQGFISPQVIHENFDPKEMSVMQQVYDIYGKYDGITLSKLTHKPNSPWSITWGDFGQNSEIPNDLIEAHFRSLYEQYQESRETRDV